MVPAVASLLSAAAVRERAGRLLALGANLPNFAVHDSRLDDAVELVLATTRASYPNFDIPFHSRWRHFEVDGVDRWAVLAGRIDWPTAAARARAAFDLAIVSVLLDAGAGPAWAYRDAGSGRRICRSEGLAVASMAMFAKGAFSFQPSDPLRADAAVLAELSDESLARGFQVGPENRLVGLAGRCAVLRRLGEAVVDAPAVFARADEPRLGGFFDHLVSLAANGHLAAPTILAELLTRFGPIWPSRLTVDGVALGDCWRHSALVTGDGTDGLVPFHKLSQW